MCRSSYPHSIKNTISYHCRKKNRTETIPYKSLNVKIIFHSVSSHPKRRLSNLSLTLTGSMYGYPNNKSTTFQFVNKLVEGRRQLIIVKVIQIYVYICHLLSSRSSFRLRLSINTLSVRSSSCKLYLITSLSLRYLT